MFLVWASLQNNTFKCSTTINWGKELQWIFPLLTFKRIQRISFCFIADKNMFRWKCTSHCVFTNKEEPVEEDYYKNSLMLLNVLFLLILWGSDSQTYLNSPTNFSRRQGQAAFLKIFFLILGRFAESASSHSASSTFKFIQILELTLGSCQAQLNVEHCQRPQRDKASKCFKCFKTKHQVHWGINFAAQ